MGGDHHFLPTVELQKKDDGSVFHPQYMFGLLPPSISLDEPHYRGDIYEEKPSALAKKWETETKVKLSFAFMFGLTVL